MVLYLKEKILILVILYMNHQEMDQPCGKLAIQTEQLVIFTSQILIQSSLTDCIRDCNLISKFSFKVKLHHLSHNEWSVFFNWVEQMFNFLCRFRQYGLWERYTDLYSNSDLVYTVGSSNYTSDWFFAQVLRFLLKFL